MLKYRFENLIENFTILVAIIVAALISAMFMYFTATIVQEGSIISNHILKETTTVGTNTESWGSDTTSWKQNW